MSGLHITCGEANIASMLRGGLEGSFLSWLDVLHEGPVPGLSPEELRPVRAGFLASQGWSAYEKALSDLSRRDEQLARDHDEVTLWFEKDLFDQLQLCQILDRFAGGGGPRRLFLVTIDHADLERIPELLETRAPVTAGMIGLGAAAWQAFTSGDPRSIERLLEGPMEALPCLERALRRHLEQFPSARNGLSRTEQQILEAISRGIGDAKLLFAANQRMDGLVFVGDVSFFRYLDGLAGGAVPFVRKEGGEFRLTEAGRQALDGKADWVRLNGIDRWLGGVHLEGREAAWRWDGEARRLVAET